MFQANSINDENGAENRLRRAKASDISTRNVAPNGQKRTVLGTITNQTRVQPLRAAKAQPFTIHVDDDSQTGQPTKPLVVTEKAVSIKETSRSQLSSAIAALPSKQPLSTVFTSSRESVHDSSITDLELTGSDSPMVLDISVDERQVDKRDRESIILTVPEYQEEIYSYLRAAELRNRPKPQYMRKQPDITTSMRSILVDWLVEVADEYKLHRETLFLSVNYIDRFLSQMSVLRGKLQLVGAASMFLAAKYEEIYPPDVSEFVYITDDTYTKKQVLRMEHLVLKVLSFDVAVPTANWFCEHFLKQCDADNKLEALTMFLTELTMVDAETFLKYEPSMIAASALCLANHTLHKPSWPMSLATVTEYSRVQLSSCLNDLYQTFVNCESHPQQAVRDKYKTTKYHQVSLERPPSSLPQ